MGQNHILCDSSSRSGAYNVVLVEPLERARTMLVFHILVCTQE